jgi:hypothetical protein
VLWVPTCAEDRASQHGVSHCLQHPSAWDRQKLGQLRDQDEFMPSATGHAQKPTLDKDAIYAVAVAP